MKGLCYIDKERLEIREFPMPKITNPTDVLVEIKYASICTSDIHILKDKVPRAKKGIILGHEGVGVIKEIGSEIKNFQIGDKVSINCITFCGNCYFCKQGYINNCAKGGWELGCRMNGTLAKYVLVPFGDSSLNKIPDNCDIRKCLFVGDALSSGYFGVEMGNLKAGDLVAVIGCGPVGLCTLICCKLKKLNVIAFDINENCLNFAKKLNLADFFINPNNLQQSKDNFCFQEISKYLKDNSLITKENAHIVQKLNAQKGFDAAIEVAGGDESFELSWKVARPNGTVAIVAMYEQDQVFKLPLMYGKNLTFKTGGVDAVNCDKLIRLIDEGELSADNLITHEFGFDEILGAFDVFRKKIENCVKISIKF